MSPIPASAVAKFERAAEHLEALKGEMLAFEQSKPYGVREQINDDRTERTLYMVENQATPQRFGLIVGDCVHNLRGVLDHLVFNLPRVTGTNPHWVGWSQFPICDDSTKLAGRWKDTLGVDPLALAVVEELQPYFGGKDPVGQPLWYLRELSNLDKHRLLQDAALIRNGFGIEIPIPAAGTVHAVVAEGAVEHDAIIGKIYYSDPSPPGVQMTVTQHFAVTIRELDPPIGVQTCLEAIQVAIEQAMSRLSPFCP